MLFLTFLQNMADRNNQTAQEENSTWSLKQLEDPQASFSAYRTEVENQEPKFDLYINNTLITNNASVSLKPSRIIDIKIKNTSTITADGTVMYFHAPLAFDPTNLICAGWTIEPKDFSTINGKLTEIPIGNEWEWEASSSIAGKPSGDIFNFGLLYNVASLEISTNFTLPAMQVAFQIHALNSRFQAYLVTLDFK